MKAFFSKNSYTLKFSLEVIKQIFGSIKTIFYYSKLIHIIIKP